MTKRGRTREQGDDFKKNIGLLKGSVAREWVQHSGELAGGESLFTQDGYVLLGRRESYRAQNATVEGGKKRKPREGG